MKIRCVVVVILLCMIPCFFSACSKSDPEELIVGPWGQDGSDIVYTFRKNKGWIALKEKDAAKSETENDEGKDEVKVEEKVEGKVDGKVEGKWALEKPEKGKTLYLVITPEIVGAESTWVKNKPVKFELIEITRKILVIKPESGEVENWKKLGKFSDEEKPVVAGAIIFPLDPIVVNLKPERRNEPYRYLCISLEVRIKNADGLDYIFHEVNPETGSEAYHVHPRINDVGIMYFSSIMYKDIRTLDKVKSVVDGFKDVLQPYFKGKLMGVGVTRIVVTTKKEGVDEFLNPKPAEETPEKGKGEHSGPKENAEGEGNGKPEGHGEKEQIPAKPDQDGEKGHGEDDAPKEKGPAGH